MRLWHACMRAHANVLIHYLHHTKEVRLGRVGERGGGSNASLAWLYAHGGAVAHPVLAHAHASLPTMCGCVQVLLVVVLLVACKRLHACSCPPRHAWEVRWRGEDPAQWHRMRQCCRTTLQLYPRTPATHPCMQPTTHAASPASSPLPPTPTPRLPHPEGTNRLQHHLPCDEMQYDDAHSSTAPLLA